MRPRMPVLMALGLAISAFLLAGPTPAGAQPDSTYVPISWRLVPEQPCVRDSVELQFDFCLCNTRFLGAERVDSAHVRVRVSSNPLVVCFSCEPDSVPLALGRYAAGAHHLDIELTRVILRPDSLPDSVAVTHHDLDFAVTTTCAPPGTLPYVRSIAIGRPGPCDPCPPVICPEESIRVFLEGSFPTSCFRLVRIELLPSPIMNPLPQPPLLRLIVDDGHGCGTCLPGPNPWHAEVTLPPLPPLQYGLIVQLARVSCTDSFPPGDLFSTRVPFVVGQRCSLTHEGCFVAKFARGDGDRCDAFVAPHQRPTIPLEVASAIPLAGLQGVLVFDPPGLRVWSLEAVGPASGMRLEWRRTLNGARFVLFADHGAPIPASTPSWLDHGTPVLGVTVSLPDSEPLPPGFPAFSRLFATDLVASDSTGQGVPLCPIPPNVRLDLSARICLEPGCDWDGNGVSDVRDLVVMAHCILGKAGCTDRFFDCNADSVQNIDDVLCCARAILGGGPPDTTHGRSEPGISVSFGEPKRSAGGVDLPITLHGADRIGAARLGLRFPSERFEITGVDFPQDPEWLDLYEAGVGRVVIGLIGTTGPDGPTQGELAMTVHLALKPGQEVGGEVALDESQFSGPDGVGLEVGFVKPALPLSGAGRVALAAAQPNPFSAQTRFSVGLVEASDLEVGIYDLVGRRVATLYRGRKPGGTHEFTWDGRDASGARASSGIYFYRASAAGQVVGRKVVFLGGR